MANFRNDRSPSNWGGKPRAVAFLNVTFTNDEDEPKTVRVGKVGIPLYEERKDDVEIIESLTNDPTGENAANFVKGLNVSVHVLNEDAQPFNFGFKKPEVEAEAS